MALHCFDFKRLTGALISPKYVKDMSSANLLAYRTENHCQNVLFPPTYQGEIYALCFDWGLPYLL